MSRQRPALEIVVVDSGGRVDGFPELYERRLGTLGEPEELAELEQDPGPQFVVVPDSASA